MRGQKVRQAVHDTCDKSLVGQANWHWGCQMTIRIDSGLQHLWEFAQDCEDQRPEIRGTRRGRRIRRTQGVVYRREHPFDHDRDNQRLQLCIRTIEEERRHSFETGQSWGPRCGEVPKNETQPLISRRRRL